MLGTIKAALAPQPVTMAASLGRCALTLADLAGLAEGDVLLFDRKIGAPLPIALDGGNRLGKCTVEQAGDNIQLRLLEAIIR